MIDRPRHIDNAPESEAEAISRASDQDVRDYVRRGIMERWLSRLVHSLNWLEGRAGDARPCPTGSAATRFPYDRMTWAMADAMAVQ